MIAKLVSMMKKGSERVMEVAKQVEEEIKKEMEQDDDTFTKVNAKLNEMEKKDKEMAKVIEQYKKELHEGLSDKEKEEAVTKGINTAIKMSSQKEDSEGLKGLSFIDFSMYIKKEAVKELIKIVDRVEQNKFYGIQKDDYDNLMKLLDSDSELNKLFFNGTLASDVKDDESMRGVFFRLYNSKLEKNSKLAKEALSSYFANKVKDLNNKAIKIQKEMNSDLSVLEKKFKKIKNEYTDNITTSHIRDTVKSGDTSKFEDDANVKFYGKGEEGSTNSEKLKNYLLRVERVGLGKIKSFISTWATVEGVRLRMTAMIPQSIRQATKAKRQAVYEKYEKQYGEDFTDRVFVKPN